MKAVNYWWVKPHYLLLLFIIPIYLLVFLAGSGSEDNYNYFTLYYFLLGLAYLIVLAVSAFVGQKLLMVDDGKYRYNVNILFLDITAGLTIAAYFIWFGEAILNPQLIAKLLIERTVNLRGEISTIPGITTFTQLGVVYAVFYSIARWVLKVNLPSRFRIYFYAIIFLTVFRTVAWSERLGLIELTLPVMLIYLSAVEIKGKLWRTIIKLGPFAGIVVLIVFFSTAEYFRSWLAWAQYGSKSFFSFMFERFYAYYHTSLNNGAGFLTEFPWPEFKGQYTFSWIYGFPILGENIAELVGLSRDSILFMDIYGLPGYTTFTGIFPVFYDFGIIGALVYAAIFGGISGLFYLHFKNRTGIGLALYPMLFIGLSETLRLLYLGTTRIFPIFLFLIIGYLVSRKQKHVNE